MFRYESVLARKGPAPLIQPGFGDKDSNLDKQSQSLLSCRWTIPE